MAGNTAIPQSILDPPYWQGGEIGGRSFRIDGLVPRLDSTVVRNPEIVHIHCHPFDGEIRDLAVQTQMYHEIVLLWQKTVNDFRCLICDREHPGLKSVSHESGMSTADPLDDLFSGIDGKGFEWFEPSQENS